MFTSGLPLREHESSRRGKEKQNPDDLFCVRPDYEDTENGNDMSPDRIFSLWPMASLAIASWETIYHRTMLMAIGACSPDEYQRMVGEKVEAGCASVNALMTGQGGTAVMAPYLKAAESNAKRLRVG